MKKSKEIIEELDALSASQLKAMHRNTRGPSISIDTLDKMVDYAVEHSQQQTPTIRRRLFITWSKYAAAAVVVITTSVYFLFQENNQANPISMEEVNVEHLSVDVIQEYIIDNMSNFDNEILAEFVEEEEELVTPGQGISTEQLEEYLENNDNWLDENFDSDLF